MEFRKHLQLCYKILWTLEKGEWAKEFLLKALLHYTQSHHRIKS